MQPGISGSTAEADPSLVQSRDRSSELTFSNSEITLTCFLNYGHKSALVTERDQITIIQKSSKIQGKTLPKIFSEARQKLYSAH